MASIYNSQKIEYKTPFGAVKAGESVCFTLHIPSSYHCEEPHLVLEKDGGETVQLPLEKVGQNKETDLFHLCHIIQEAGLYFYWFDLWVDYRKLYQGVLGEAVERTEPGKPYQLTVYDPAFRTPQSVHGGVMYQIFPDRFFEGDPGKEKKYPERIYRKDKNKEPYFWPLEHHEGYLTLDYFGGDFAGIRKRLPFLHTLGVNWIYLNPIFEAHSNHRYNTADYLRVDPYLGTNEDFIGLCKEAKEFGIRIILDGVFSHTGSDSIYFNREGRYNSFGAWQGHASPYRQWYNFRPDGSYETWWGFESLPACNKNNPDYRNFICGEGGVIDTWLGYGASGFRLDVADELPDDFIRDIRQAVKRNGEENLLIGEVWEDASNKISYDVRRKYFWGSELDGVMNYPFRAAILEFFEHYDAASFADSVMHIVENYPPPAMAATTNHLSTHDTVRVITALAGDKLENQDRNWQSGRRLSPEQYHLGLTQLQLAFVLQFTLPGVPCVYYGDEIAMQGYKDPFNRAYYDWTSGETVLIQLMMELSQLRQSCPAFKEGSLHFLQAENGILAFEREGGGAKAAIAINCSGWPVAVELLGQELIIPMMGYAWRTS